MDAHGRTWAVETARGRNAYLRCGRCRAYVLDRPYDPNTEVEHTGEMPWGQLEAGLALNRYKQRMFMSVLGVVEVRCPPPARVLDVGCSFGGFAELATPRGYEVYGMDISPVAIDHVSSQGLGAECCGNPDDLRSLDPPTVDVVTCLDCHAYWPNQPAQLEAMARRLPPGGLLVLRVIDKSWMFTIGRGLRRLTPGLAATVMRRAVGDHRFSMPLHRMVSEVERHGFRVDNVSIRAAVHSRDARASVKAGFLIGAVAWRLTRRNIAPGAVIVARRAGES